TIQLWFPRGARVSAGLLRPLGQSGALDLGEPHDAVAVAGFERDRVVRHVTDAALEGGPAAADVGEEVVEAREVPRGDERPLWPGRLHLQGVRPAERIE